MECSSFGLGVGLEGGAATAKSSPVWLGLASLKELFDVPFSYIEHKNVRIGDPSFEPAILELCMHSVCRYLNIHNFYGIDELDYIW